MFHLYFESVTDSFELFDWPLQSNVFDGKVQNIVKIYEVIRNNKFPDSLKLSDITPVYKKLDPTDTDYTPLSVLPLSWKVFEKII